MTAQLALPGFDFTSPDPLAEARSEAARLRAAWSAVAHIQDSPERSRLQPRYFRALILVDRLERGPQWWHGGGRGAAATDDHRKEGQPR